MELIGIPPFIFTTEHLSQFKNGDQQGFVNLFDITKYLLDILGSKICFYILSYKYIKLVLNW